MAKRPRIKASLCAYTYKEDGQTKVQIIHHNVIVPRIRTEIEQFRKQQREKRSCIKKLF
jgi:hypothetical protein